jgi:DNA invertase Pin-like site-specific DNA recombinase
MTTKTNATKTTNLPTTEKAALYIRQAQAHSAHPARDKNVRERNTEALLQLAHKAGWTDDLLVIFNDSGLPPSSTLDKREGMRSLISSIEQDEIKAVFLTSEHTLYRDAAAIVDLRFFTQLCRRHGVFVITPQAVYDFADPASARLFLFAIEATNFTISRRIGKKTTRNKRNQA